jgi:hypothetical protein
MVANKRRCQGKRRGFRARGNSCVAGIFRCMRKATGIIETHMGFTEHRYVCDDEECFRSITGGYPANFTPIQSQ